MAIDVCLQLDGIRGESSDARHKSWIECESMQWAVEQPKSASSSTAGGHSVERCVHRQIVVRKLSDLATPILLQTCSMGRTIPQGRIELMRADGNGDRVLYFEIELENILIGDIFPEIHPGEVMSEHLGLKYSKVKWRYARQKVSGGVAGLTVGGWDLATNRIA